MIPKFRYLSTAISGVNSDWLKVLSYDALHEIDQYLFDKSNLGQIIYPLADNIFNALRFVSPSAVRVLILGQDPYHRAGQAMGMSFSVNNGVGLPPSLRNIYKELHNDIGCDIPKNGDLSPWAKQGVLLLNSVLTVNAGQPASHEKIGWQSISDEIIRLVNQESEACVFILWGKFAIKKLNFIDTKRHLVLSAAHPSPFAAHRGFFGCCHFSKANEWLKNKGFNNINWII